MKDRIRIGNGQGFWGDSVDAPYNLVMGGPLDCLTLDYLAEVTMSIMQRQKHRNPLLGYATDFIDVLRRILPECTECGVKIIANAGGVNPRACVESVKEALLDMGLEDIRLAMVEGDDILPELDDLLADDEVLANMDTGLPLSSIRKHVVSANVYLDSFTIAEALHQEADIVITGRCTDPGLALGPMICEFGWDRDDWDLLAAGTVAGHILECGVQATGGNYTRWQEVPDLAGIGYPIAEVTRDGNIIITKQEGTGGMVTVETVSEQLLYELGDPTEYVTPDVVVDFTSIHLDQVAPNSVRVSGIKGSPATNTYKASINYTNGWKASGQLTISGPDATAKAKMVSEIIWERLRRTGFEYEQTHTELIGQECIGRKGDTALDSVDTLLLVLGVKDHDYHKVERFGKEIAPVITSGPPGVTGFAGGRPKPKEVIAFWPALIKKEHIKPRVTVVTV
jgi:hypothetical protein